jgi:NAD(P)-dependent dehydrogenase (short-subunit alcohol dehydrogenase family)
MDDGSTSMNRVDQAPHAQAPVALVTGGGRGLGRAASEALARAGFAVAAVARSEKEISAVADEIRASGGNAIAIQADVTNPEDVRRAFSETRHALGPIDLLLNNAGGGTAMGPTWEDDVDEWWADVKLNLLSVFLCSHQALPEMVERSSGRIINVASYWAHHPHPFYAAYCCSKAAVLSFTESVALAGQPHGVSTFVVDPALIRTRLEDSFRQSPRGRKWLPEFLEFTEEDYTPASDTATLIVELALGKADALSGRCIRTRTNLETLLAEIDEIRDRELYVLRLGTLVSVETARVVGAGR